MSSHTESFLQGSWRKLKKNRVALFSLVVIVLAVFLALFAHLLAPDPTPDANRMIVEIGGKKAGYRQPFLMLPKENPPAEVNFLQRMLLGREDAVLYIPVQRVEWRADSVIAFRQIEEGLEVREAYAAGRFGVSDENTFRDRYVGSQVFRLGTDKYGRDIVSRLLVGIRVSLGVGLVAVFISLTIGIALGAMAGYYRGRIDDIIQWFINVVWSIPTLLLVFAITLALGKGFWQVFMAVGLTLWVNVARVIRGQVLSIREREFVEAGKALGFRDTRIIIRHVIPNVLGPVLVMAASNFATAIVLEAGLSFLGVGVQAPMPSWGLMIKENYNFIITNNPLLALAPGFCIMILVLAFNLLGNGLRDAMDVRG